jgi:glycosyltransferase involved in cell wall biosynthesis
VAVNAVRYDIVVPTVGRDCVGALLDALAQQAADHHGQIVLVDDRSPASPGRPLERYMPERLAGRTTVIASGGRGPAAARNLGWRATRAPWVVFLDDDVVPGPTWCRALEGDLRTAEPGTGAVQGAITVPRPADRPPTDRERNVARLESARWITADLAVRRDVLEQVDGFDERFPRAYREDTDFHLRATAAGHRFARGRRSTRHPVRPAPWWSSLAAQRGNADDALLRALHGRAALDHGRRNRHQLVTACAVLAVLGVAIRRPAVWRVALGCWLAGTAELAMARIRGGPRHAKEVAAMLATSVAIPPAATYHWWRGRWRWRAVRPAAGVSARSEKAAGRVADSQPSETRRRSSDGTGSMGSVPRDRRVGTAV